MALPTPPLPPPVPAAAAPPPPPPPTTTATKPNLNDLSSDESEMESSEVVIYYYVRSRKRMRREIKVTPKPTTKETTDYSDSTKEPDSANQLLEQKLFASPQEIESGKLPPEEILSLPMFKVPQPSVFLTLFCM
ncbi:hypothetical protein GW17_00033190 [Ensete ventricosum]|uniref:Uncharacterized protein n=1 Tax=Ensete ventricosum TaxID=4639 RepID=A0A427AA63_ENSVE|nr:hypothetical protein B296_00006125 [Ensete ventricosum]RWW03631.1 hypothetical protein GW17_00033190 [Ensete ventricosum]RZS14708.1 hypothetical protein BHM03_00046431 [Ensete ventricosum]